MASRTLTEQVSVVDVLSAALDKAVERHIESLARSVERRMLNTRRAMVYLDIGRTTLEALVHEGKLHPVRYREGGVLFYEIAELDALIRAGRKMAGTDVGQ